jgi:hypothetical protein
MFLVRENLVRLKRRFARTRCLTSNGHGARIEGGAAMVRLDERTIAHMEAALEKVCRKFPNGGDHETRKFIAQKLKLSAKKGNTTLGGLSTVAHRALDDLSKRASA